MIQKGKTVTKIETKLLDPFLKEMKILILKSS
jgi:hypothetical protein